MKTRNESGQAFIESILWITLFAVTAVGYLKLSDLDYRKYRSVLRKYESRAGGTSFP